MLGLQRLRGGGSVALDISSNSLEFKAAAVTASPRDTPARTS